MQGVFGRQLWRAVLARDIDEVKRILHEETLPSEAADLADVCQGMMASYATDPFDDDHARFLLTQIEETAVQS